jgi:miniconductance mechanosensitive channel
MENTSDMLCLSFNSATGFLASTGFYFLLGTLVACVVLFCLTRAYVNPLLIRFICRKNHNWIPVFKKLRTLNQLAYLFPAFLFMIVSTYWKTVWEYTDNVLDAFIAVNITLLLASLVRTANSVYELYPLSKEKPVKSYSQLVVLIIYIFGGIIAICQITDTNPTAFLGGAVAVMAAILLVFRDTILSFIASMQIAANNLIIKGDWIVVPAFGADGTVIDIALHVLRVQNFDKTIVTIPTYKIMEVGFRNYRGMFESGGRQFKSSLYLDLNSICFMTEADYNRIKQNPMVQKYLPSADELKEEHNVADLNAITNSGMLRSYLMSYLKQHTKINQDMTLLVRLLEPTAGGLPLQFYCYTSDTRWVYHEGIKGQIMEHTLSLLDVFGLRVYQTAMDTDIAVIDRVSQNIMKKQKAS